MALRDWPPATIRNLWLLGAVLEAALVAWMFSTGGSPAAASPPSVPDSARVSLVAPRDPAQREKLDRILRDSVGIAVTRQGDSLATFQKDSFAATFVLHRDSVREIRLSPAAEREVGRTVGAVLGPPMQALGDALPSFILWFLGMLALTFLPSRLPCPS